MPGAGRFGLWALPDVLPADEDGMLMVCICRGDMMALLECALRT